MITTGPTYESIDSVVIGNRSSGKMGFSIALEAAKGARVKLIAGLLLFKFHIHL